MGGLVVADDSASTPTGTPPPPGRLARRARMPGICGIDTRALTKRLRERGAMRGRIVDGDATSGVRRPQPRNLVAEVSAREVTPTARAAQRGPVDCGVKANILRCLRAGDARRARAVGLRLPDADYDGVFISNGPGDPKDCGQDDRHHTRAWSRDKPDLRHLPRQPDHGARRRRRHLQAQVRPPRPQPAV